MGNIKKERKKAAILAAKLTDEEIDNFFENPGVAKYFRAFAEGKTVLAEIGISIRKVKYAEFFDMPSTKEYRWTILQELESNMAES